MNPFLRWLFVTLLFWGKISAQAPSLEYQVKASYLYNFLQFIQWSGEEQNDSIKFVLVILGEDRFGRAVDSLQGKLIRGRPLIVKRLHDVNNIRDCQVVFVSASEEDRETQIIQRLKDRNILTVGETDTFAARGGIISFVIEDDRVRFEINQAAAHAANMRISSKLFRLAIRVYEDD